MSLLGQRLGGGLARSTDSGVQDTNDDAQLSKLSCVRHGYFQDDFVHHFVRRPARRSPLINRGYYSRYAALRTLLLQFLALESGQGGSCRGAAAAAPPSGAEQAAAAAAATAARPAGAAGAAPAANSPQQQGQQRQQQQGGGAAPPPQHPHEQLQDRQPAAAPPRRLKQVLVLGAGYDTAFFQLAAEGVRADLYVEIDFLQVAQKKAAAIRQLPDLLACVGGEATAASISPEEGRVVTDRYCLLPADLREPGQLAAALAAAGLDPAQPTFVLSECVLVYLPPQHSAEVVRWLAGHLQCAAMAVYEQINPHDAFGQQMLLNLETRGCALLGIEATPSLAAQRARFTDAGWHRAEAASMDTVYSCCIDPADRRRIERLEIFDEFEEWRLIQQHYCIAVAVKDDTGSGLLDRFGLPRFEASAPAGPQSAGLGGPPPPPPPRFAM